MFLKRIKPKGLKYNDFKRSKKQDKREWLLIL
jgi:hypothetical protein